MSHSCNWCQGKTCRRAFYLNGKSLQFFTLDRIRLAQAAKHLLASLRSKGHGRWWAWEWNWDGVYVGEYRYDYLNLRNFMHIYICIYGIWYMLYVIWYMFLRKPADRPGKVVFANEVSMGGVEGGGCPGAPKFRYRVVIRPWPLGFFKGGHVPLGNLVTVGFDSPQVPWKRKEKGRKNQGKWRKIVKNRGKMEEHGGKWRKSWTLKWTKKWMASLEKPRKSRKPVGKWGICRKETLEKP